MSAWTIAAVAWLEWLLLAYLAALGAVQVALTILSAWAVRRDADARASLELPRFFSGLEPPVSLLVPAWNEESAIAGRVRSLLALDYPELEVIVVNDGSTDGTLETLRREFELVPFPEAYRVAVPTREIRGVFRSLTHPNLRVVDKENGGKSDALNAALNAAHAPLSCAVGAGALLRRDSLLRLARPFLGDRSTVASGCADLVANGCRVDDGIVEEHGLPSSWLARVQTTERLRASLFGRLGWSPLGAVLVISGALALYRRTEVIEAGGWRTDLYGADMELVTRLQRRHRLAGEPCRVAFVPDPLCFTEAPGSLPVLRARRRRWQRGLLDNLHANRRLLLHPRGGTPGWLAFPALLALEAAGPTVELLAWAFFAGGLAAGLVTLQAALAFLVGAVGVGMLVSMSSVMLAQIAFGLYRPRELATLLLAAAIEHLGYRQLAAWWRLRATFSWVCGKVAAALHRT